MVTIYVSTLYFKEMLLQCNYTPKNKVSFSEQFLRDLFFLV